MYTIHYCDHDEHEDPEYQELCTRVNAFILTPRPETIIYENKIFLTEKICHKYQPIVD